MKSKLYSSNKIGEVQSYMKYHLANMISFESQGDEDNKTGHIPPPLLLMQGIHHRKGHPAESWSPQCWVAAHSMCSEQDETQQPPDQ